MQQRRGRGTHTYRSISFRFKGEIKHPSANGTVIDLVHCAGHTAPLMELAHAPGLRKENSYAFAPLGVKIGDEIGLETIGNGSVSVREGNVLSLRNIPEGTLIHNLELSPGDGGKLVRSSGTFAKIIAKSEESVRILLPSRKEKLFLPDCRAAIGALSGGGRLEKPFLKAGAKYKRMRARNKLYPHVCGISMNAVDHPFGGKCSHIKGRPTQSPRSAPPGRKVGKIAPRRTGRKGR
ncbi:50S ribosomal protein L2 [Candidatus Woesearchaeota archaeon]|nr:50S ribosomal protein L2 [Candidatus Woesearchaeota archaeon]